MTSEKVIEKKLCQMAIKHGGYCYKFSSPNRRNVPDRICVFPKGKAVFVECKGTGKKVTQGQQREIDRLQKLGFDVRVVDSLEILEEWNENLSYPNDIWRKLL